MSAANLPSTSPSELADYAYCPRSHWYHQHPPPGGPTRDGVRRSEAGAQYHARTLHATRVRSERGAAYWVLVVLGVLLLVGGALWLLY